MYAIRHRAETLAEQIIEYEPPPLIIGYMAVSLSLTEAATQLREAAYHPRPTPAALRTIAAALDDLAHDATLLAEAAGHEPGGPA